MAFVQQQPGDWFGQFQNPVMPGGEQGPAIDNLTINDIPGRNPTTGAIDTNTTYADGSQGYNPPPGTLGGMGQGAGGSDPGAFGRAWLASGGKTPADLQAFVAAHPEFGATLFGSKLDKIKFANGEEYDGVLSAGLGGLGASFNRIGAGNGVGGAGVDFGSIGLGTGDYLRPFSGQFNLPTAEEARSTPGYQFALGEGLKGVQNSAAARGTLLSGGTLKALNNYAQNFAETGYQNRVNNSLTQFNTNRSVFEANQDRPFSKLTDLARLGRPGT